MTNFSEQADNIPRGETALRIYADDPLEDGDAVLLIDDTVCLEIERLADEWDDIGRRNLADILTKTARRVLVAIARDGGELLPGRLSALARAPPGTARHRGRAVARSCAAGRLRRRRRGEKSGPQLSERRSTGKG